MTSYLQLLKSVHRVGFDDEGGDGGGTGEGGGGEEMISKAEMDSHLAGIRRKYESQIEQFKNQQREHAEELKKARNKKGVSDEERVEYDKRIKQLEDNFLTEKEKLERKSKSQMSAYEEQISELTASRDGAVDLYRNEVVRNQIYSASAKHDGHDPDQFDATISRWIEWEDNLVDGEPDGTTRPVVNFPDTDKDGKPVTMKFTIDECVKRMKEIPKHQNLFKPNLKPGLGSGPNAGGPKVIDAAKLAKENPAEYRRMRREEPERLYASMKGN